MERRRIKFPVMVAGAKNMNGHIYTKESCNSVMEDINHKGVLIFNDLEPVGAVVKSYFIEDVLFAEGNLSKKYTEKYTRVTSTGYGVLGYNGLVESFSIRNFQLTPNSAFENLIDCSLQYIYKRNIKI